MSRRDDPAPAARFEVDEDLRPTLEPGILRTVLAVLSGAVLVAAFVHQGHEFWGALPSHSWWAVAAVIMGVLLLGLAIEHHRLRVRAQRTVGTLQLAGSQVAALRQQLAQCEEANEQQAIEAKSQQERAIQEAVGAETKRRQGERRALRDEISGFIEAGKQLLEAAHDQRNAWPNKSLLFELDDELADALARWRTDVRRVLRPHLDDAAVRLFDQRWGKIRMGRAGPGEAEIDQLLANIERLEGLLARDPRLQPL